MREYQPEHLPEQSLPSIPKIRGLLQVELMKKNGLSDENFRMWQIDHYSEDFAVAFSITQQLIPNIEEVFVDDKESVLHEVEAELIKIHALREETLERLITKSGGGQIALPKEIRDTWILKYGDIYNKVFNAEMDNRATGSVDGLTVDDIIPDVEKQMNEILNMAERAHNV